MRGKNELCICHETRAAVMEHIHATTAFSQLAKSLNYLLSSGERREGRP